jgi:hypothetical protein
MRDTEMHLFIPVLVGRLSTGGMSEPDGEEKAIKGQK